MALWRTEAVLDYSFLALHHFHLPEKAALLLPLTLVTSFLGSQSYTLAALACALISADAFVEVYTEEHNYIYSTNFSSHLLIGFLVIFFFYFKEWKHTLAT